jgi:hypothetical protein
MKSPMSRGLLPVVFVAVLAMLAILTLPGSVPAQTSPGQDPSAPADSLQAEPTDSIPEPPPEPTSAPPPAAAPAAGITTTPPPAAAPAPSTAPPPATAPAPSTAPPPAAAPAAQSAETPPPAQAAAPAGRKEPFSKGTTRVSITGGWGRSFNEDYLMLGIGAGRFIANGLNFGVDFEAWMLGDPGVFKISPNVGYVLSSPRRRTKPYVGGFWRRTMVENADDLSSVGGRAGAYFKGAGPLMIGGGAVWENYLDCEEKGYEDCSQVYPEFLISASF